ncbi:MAG: regulatory protein RecX [Candidatus Thermochlorobacter sp.]
MTITAMAAQAYRPERIKLFIDGEYRFSLSLKLVASLGLKVGQSLSAEETAALQTAAALDDAQEAMYAMLARRAHSRKELTQKLRRKGFADDIIAQALQKAEAQGLIDDQAFAETFVRRRRRQTELGTRKLQAELYQKGISHHIVQRTLSGMEKDEEALCYAAAEKKWKALQKEPDAQKRRRKLFDFLLRRGFEWELVQRATAALLRASDAEH